jgi:hypothetical protein
MERADYEDNVCLPSLTPDHRPVVEGKTWLKLTHYEGRVSAYHKFGAYRFVVGPQKKTIGGRPSQRVPLHGEQNQAGEMYLALT